MVLHEIKRGTPMARPSKKLEQYIYHNELEKYHRKLKEGIRSQLIPSATKGNIAYPLFPIDIIGVDHYATIKLKNRYICHLSLLQDKHPKDWTKYYEEEIIENIIFPTIIYKPKVRKVA